MNTAPGRRLAAAIAAAGIIHCGALCLAQPSEPQLRPAGLAGSADTPGPKPGWLRVAKSLLYYDADGQLSNEIGLGRWEDPDPAQVRVKIIDGGAAPNSRFAWTMDKRTTWNTLKTKVLESKRVLRFFDASAQELWNEEEADAIPGSAALVFSHDGEICLLAARRQNGWFALVKSYLGNTIWEAGPFPQLYALQISANGRYGLARWNDPDKSAAYSFLDISGQARQDVPSDKFMLGKTAIDDEGRAYSGQNLVFSFSGPALSTAAAPAISTGPLQTPAAAPPRP